MPKKHGVWFEVDTKLNIYTKLRKLGAAVVLLSSNDAKGNSISKKVFFFYLTKTGQPLCFREKIVKWNMCFVVKTTKLY